MATIPIGLWGVILGGSSGFGLATAQVLASQGLNVCIVHRDRKGAMSRIDAEFDKIRACGVELLSFNADALRAECREQIIASIAERVAPGKVRLLLHSVAYGSLKLLAPPPRRPARGTVMTLARDLGVSETSLADALRSLFEDGDDSVHTLLRTPDYPGGRLLDDEDFARTIHAMGTSLVSWARDLLEKGLFAPDARIIGLTSEGNEIAWLGYAAVSAAKGALEAVARSLAVELAPFGVRVNIVQPGVTETPALKAIPGSRHLAAHARLRNPYRRLTTPVDVANAIYLLTTDEASWINGALIRVDGGEHVSGLLS